MSGLLRSGVYFDADKGAGSGGGGQQPPANDPPKETPGQGGTDGNAPGGEGPKSGEDKVTLSAKELQDRIDNAVKDRLDRAKKKADADAAKAKTDAEAAQLEQNKEWEKLAGTQKARIAELEKQVADGATVAGERDRYKAALDGYVKTAKADLPKHILALLDKLDPVDQLAYIAENAAALKSAGTGQGADKKGPPASPKGSNGQQPTDEAARAAQARFTHNRF